MPQYEDAATYADHYYREKFGVAPGDAAARRQIVADYVLGLFWCVQYYHRGVESWDWFYPHLYAPLASDLVDLRAGRTKGSRSPHHGSRSRDTGMVSSRSL